MHYGERKYAMRGGYIDKNIKNGKNKKCSQKDAIQVDL